MYCTALCNAVNYCVISQNHDTPLHEAAWAGHANVIEVLLSLNADINAINRVRLLYVTYICITYYVTNRVYFELLSIQVLHVELM